MSVEITFTADTVPELMAQMLAFIHPGLPQGSPQEGKDVDVPREPAQPKKASPRPPKAAPEPEKVPVEEMFVEEEAALDAKALLEVKNRTIAVLQQAFANGKVTKLRKLLETYGDGCKSFPEIAPEKFGKIAKAIDKGALNDA